MSRRMARVPEESNGSGKVSSLLQLPISRDCSAARNVRRAEADRIVAAIGAAFGVVRSPARRVLKKPDRADPLFLAKIEPVPGAARHAQQIASFDSDRNDVAFARMDVKQAA